MPDVTDAAVGAVAADAPVVADELLDRLAAAVAARVRGRRTAEERLGAFAFHEGPRHGRQAGMAPLDRSTADESTPDSAAIDWRYFVLRALTALGDPDAVRILEALPPDGRPLDALVGLVEPDVPDPVAAADRIGRLAAAGLVGRDLESDHVSLLPLGEVLLELVRDVARRASVADR
ncbi:MAG TPA: hypothetical protein VHM48_05585 [Candidatus Limnocylindrales bacterium]|nr:hypothetical protein [Candidatus Limnocylindrales bacterium]